MKSKTWKSTLGNLRKNISWQVIWDLFMVNLAILNLSLIVFDLTYLWVRPAYVRFTPQIAGIYDQVKGIEPHPDTVRYLDRLDDLARSIASGEDVSSLTTIVTDISGQTEALFDSDPFARSAQSRSLVRIGVGMKDYQESHGELTKGVSDREAILQFWSLEPNAEALPGRLEYFQLELRPLFEANYLRRYAPTGEFVDLFFWIDLPFLLIFTLEFAIRWFLALRRSTYPRWFFFPIFNWYDLLGIIPIRQFRIFRLFRIASIYVRLHRSEHTVVGGDVISRTVKYFSNIITEEISDMVALRILNETQEELRAGTHRRIISSIVRSHGDALAAELTSRVRVVLSSDGLRSQARAFLDANLDHAVVTAPALRGVPLPDSLLRPLVTTVGRAIFESFADTMSATLESPEGRRALEEMVSDSIDSLVSQLTEGNLEEIVQEISIEVIEQVKAAVAVRKWVES